jgi:ATP phosphoribosyltransferase regulatory subunit HisZ
MEVMDVLLLVAVVEDLLALVPLRPLVQAVVVRAFQRPKLEAMELFGQEVQLRYRVQQILVLAVAAAGSLAAIITRLDPVDLGL